MKKLNILSVAVLGALLLSSCSLTVPLQVTDNAIQSKRGVSSTTCILPIPPGTMAMGNTSLIMTSGGICFNKKYGLVQAAEKANISKIATVDLKTTNYILWAKYELIVTGEQ